MKRRKKSSHKGDYGHIFILAGSRGLTGAAALCANATLRSGAGLATLGVPFSLNLMMEKKLTEVMTLPLPETKDATKFGVINSGELNREPMIEGLKELIREYEI